MATRQLIPIDQDPPERRDGPLLLLGSVLIGSSWGQRLDLLPSSSLPRTFHRGGGTALRGGSFLLVVVDGDRSLSLPFQIHLPSSYSDGPKRGSIDGRANRFLILLSSPGIESARTCYLGGLHVASESWRQIFAVVAFRWGRPQTD